MNKGSISYDSMNGYQRNNLIPLLDKKNEYNRNIIMENEIKEKNWNKISERVGTSEVIVVSYGIRGKNALKQLMLKCINVIAVCDNDKNVECRR